jgi:hypothetical protein
LRNKSDKLAQMVVMRRRALLIAHSQFPIDSLGGLPPTIIPLPINAQCIMRDVQCELLGKDLYVRIKSRQAKPERAKTPAANRLSLEWRTSIVATSESKSANSGDV